MKTKRDYIIKLNSILTRRVIDLHDKGYIHDFLPLRGQSFLCIQNKEKFGMDELNIIVIDQAYDQFTRTFKYIHTIETPDGSKGLLLADFIYTTSKNMIN
ncbi:hypothetical protein GCM10023149_10920 [Mucilaginibacter gynuensis]|uniref:Uncharacterized protein n=1 Tax=Mucilaginibacter gynuensis TaxID=1302236 RepID=A0ABP8G091_9SPHI